VLGRCLVGCGDDGSTSDGRPPNSTEPQESLGVGSFIRRADRVCDRYLDRRESIVRAQERGDLPLSEEGEDDPEVLVPYLDDLVHVTDSLAEDLRDIAPPQPLREAWRGFTTVVADQAAGLREARRAASRDDPRTYVVLLDITVEERSSPISRELRRLGFSRCGHGLFE
jgi:hypothetical protein